ncbi:MAG: hypothetical protein ACRDQA_02820 [Nocardioidaceae bacterium]
MPRRHCESCGRFVPGHHLRTIRHYYAIDRSLPVAVYSQATATVFQARLDCPDCSMRCCLMAESMRDHGDAVGSILPGGWERCAPNATQADYPEAARKAARGRG